MRRKRGGRQSISLTFEMTWGHADSAVADMARYALAESCIDLEHNTVTLTRTQRFTPSIIERAASFGWKVIDSDANSSTPSRARPHGTRAARRTPALDVTAAADLLAAMILEQGEDSRRIRSRKFVEALWTCYGFTLRTAREMLVEIHARYHERFYFEAASVNVLIDPLRFVPQIDGVYRPSIVLTQIGADLEPVQTHADAQDPLGLLIQSNTGDKQHG